MTGDGTPDSQVLEPTLLYRLLVEQTPELLCLHALDGTFLFANPASVPLLGYRPEELVGKEATGLITSSRDISVRMEMDGRLKERESTLRSVIASIDDLVFVFDREGRFREYHQPEGRDDLYRSPDDFVGRHHSKVLPPVISRPLEATLTALAEGEASAGFDYELSLGGRICAFEARLSPMLGASGELEGTVGVIREITSRKAEEEARLALLRTRARVDRLEALAALAAGTSHEFNNLLTVIQGNLSMAGEAAGELTEVQEGIGAALEAADEAAALTRSLLTSAGDFGGPSEPVDVGALLMDMKDELEEALPENTGLEMSVPASTPHMHGDRGRLRDAVRQIVKNAGDALAEGDGNRGTVEVQVYHRPFGVEELKDNRIGPPPEDGIYVAIEISDDGPGIDPEALPRIFEPFFSTRFIGRGLGLAEVAGAIRRHRGAILVQSEPGEGTHITLLVPVEAA